MAKDNSLIIKDFEQGIGPSPHTGFGDMRNLDIFTRPGVARINYSSAKVSASTVTDLPKWFIRNPRNISDVWAIGDTNRVYKGTSNGSSWSLITGNNSGTGTGGVIWKDYLFTTTSTSIDVFGPLTGTTFTVTIASPAVVSSTAHGLTAGTPIVFSTTGALPTGMTAGTTYYVIASGLGANSFQFSATLGGSAVNTSGSQSGTHTYSFWTNSWQSIDSDAAFHPMIVGQDDIVYGGAGRYVFSIREKSGSTFSPLSNTSYTYTQQALDLPAEYRIKCLAELGTSLVIGTWIGTNIYDFRIADIFFWNRSGDTFQSQIRMNEFGVNGMINVGNWLYILAGVEGKMYVTNGTQAQLYARVPRGIFTANMDAGTGLYPYPGAIITLNDRVFFGFGSTGALGGSGVWSVSLVGNKSVLNFENTISTGNDGSTNALQIGALCPIAMTTYLIGWNDNTSYGVDQVGNSLRTTSYAAYFESPLYQVGTANNKRSFNTIEFQLARPLASGQGIRLKYRKNLSDAFTTIGTWDFSTNGALTSISSGTNIVDAEFLQIRGELTTGSSSATTPELRYIRLS